MKVLEQYSLVVLTYFRVRSIELIPELECTSRVFLELGGHWKTKHLLMLYYKHVLLDLYCKCA